MFAAIRYYQADPPSIDEVVRRVQEDKTRAVRVQTFFNIRTRPFIDSTLEV